MSSESLFEEIADTLEEYDNICDDILDLRNAETLSRLIEEFSDSGEVKILRAISFALAQSDSEIKINMLAFRMIEMLQINDINVISNLLTAIKRLDQKEVEWKTDEKIQLLKKLENKLKAAIEMYKDELEDIGNFINTSED